MSRSIVVVVPSLVNFLPDSENRCPCSSILRALELQGSKVLRFLKPVHEVLDLINDSDVADAEGGAEVTWGGAILPSLLIGAIPHIRGVLAVARECGANQVGLRDDLILVDRVGCGQSWHLALDLA